MKDTFDIKRFYENANGGSAADIRGCIGYIKSFQHIILWGAGNLGREVGLKLQEYGVVIDEYWDINYGNIHMCNDVLVKEPFAVACPKEEVLVIPCIVNGSLGNRWTERELHKNGFVNTVSGMVLYEAMACPLNDGYFDIKECTSRKACSLCNCERYTNLLQHKLNNTSSLTFQLITFIISTKCTLNCKYCGQRLSEYEPSQKVNFDKDAIVRDMDHFLSAVDFVGMVSVIGGEPFVHPDLEYIIHHCLERNNFGVINITTNGIVRLTEEMLAGIKNDRVKISFSIYDTYLTEQQKEILNRNVELVKKSGIHYSLSYPLWVKPQELCQYQYEERFMEERKKGCENIKMCAAVRDGIFYPCSTAENVASLHKFPIGNSMADVKNPDGLRERIIECLQQPYFDVCKYCGSAKPEEIEAGEQV